MLVIGQLITNNNMHALEYLKIVTFVKKAMMVVTYGRLVFENGYVSQKCYGGGNLW